MVYAGDPPLTETVAVPLQPLKQDTFVLEVVTINFEGWVIEIVFLAVQLFASLTVTEYVPAVNPEISSLVEITVLLPDFFQMNE